MYIRYWVMDMQTKQCKPVSTIRRYADAAARNATREKGGTHCVMRLVASTDIVMIENKRSKR